MHLEKGLEWFTGEQGNTVLTNEPSCSSVVLCNIQLYPLQPLRWDLYLVTIFGRVFTLCVYLFIYIFTHTHTHTYHTSFQKGFI